MPVRKTLINYGHRNNNGVACKGEKICPGDPCNGKCLSSEEWSCEGRCIDKRVPCKESCGFPN